MICLIDGNNFFVSCEKVFDPTLHKKPVVVLSSNDGCIISRSAEAKSLGIKMGQPLFEVKELIEKEKVCVFSANFYLYKDLSNRMMNVIAECTSQIEIYSIDEAFIYLEPKNTSELKEDGWKIKNKIKQYVGIPCGIGISHTKVLAKLANHISKKSTKANGVLALIEDRHIDYALEQTKVEDIWGIGRKYTQFLQKHNIYTAKQFRDAPENFIQKNLSIIGLQIQKELKKEICFDLNSDFSPKKSIIVSRSFSKYAKTYDDLVSPLTHFISSGCAQLRAQESEAAGVGIFLHTNRFSNMPQYNNSCVINLPFYTSSDFHVLSAAMKGLNQIFKKGYEYKKCGIYLLKIRPQSDIPSNLFDNRDILKERKLFETCDAIREKFGHNGIIISNALDYSWKPLSALKSKEFSTNLSEILWVE